jgi:hypothetical protein
VPRWAVIRTPQRFVNRDIRFTIGSVRLSAVVAGCVKGCDGRLGRFLEKSRDPATPRSRR